MSINYCDWYYTVIRNRDEKEVVEMDKYDNIYKDYAMLNALPMDIFQSNDVLSR